MTNILVKKTLDEWLNAVDYRDLAEGNYVPSKFSLLFMNFIKLVNGSNGEEHKTPPMHLAMLDTSFKSKNDVVNLLHRGSGKTTLMFEYLLPLAAIFRELPFIGKIDSMIYISDSMENGVASARKNAQFRYEHSDFLQEYLPKSHFTEKYIELINSDGLPFGCKMFGAQTGLRGTKVFGQRPKLAVLDDLMSDDAARSKVAVEAIKDTIYKGVEHALHPTIRKVIFNGTPFNKEDPIVEAVESGGWEVNVWPVCEQFPCDKSEFRGSWEDRFTYDALMDRYNKAVAAGKTASFMQELMLRISSEEDRLVQDGDIRWYSKVNLLRNKSKFNFYITTDFAVSDKQHSDYSVIAVWAYNAQGDWFLVDGICERMTMDKTINHLFTLVQKYNPQAVGIETSGQQGAFIKWLQSEMMNRNIWFNFASNKKSGEPGIHPVANKLIRFNLVVPWFKAGKFYFPEEEKASIFISHYVGQLKLATINGLKGKDDCIDTISMLSYINAWKPSESSGNGTDEVSDEVDRWGMTVSQTSGSTLDSYIV